jgi:hypothetical protein
VSIWSSYENGARKNYTPTAEDLSDIKEAFGAGENTTQTIARGFLQGMAGQIGYSGAKELHSAIAQPCNDSQTMSDRNIIQCKTHNVSESDLERMSEQIRVTEHNLAQAEMAKNQAITETRNAQITLLNHANFPIPNELGTLVYESIPDMISMKKQEQSACSLYNHYLQKYAQEKSLYEKMRRDYNNQNQGDPGFWVSISQGVFGFFITLFSRNF